MGALPATGATPQDVKVARGRSIGYIKDIIGEALEAVAGLAAAPAQRAGGTRAARGLAPPSQPSTQSPAGRQREALRASAAAEDSGSKRHAAQRPDRGSKAQGRTAPTTRPRKTSGATVKAQRRRRGATRR